MATTDRVGATGGNIQVGKRKRLEAPAKRVPQLAQGSGATGIRALAHSALVTKESSAPTPHYVRRGRVCRGNHGLRLRAVRAVGFASATRSCLHPGTPTSNELSVPGNHAHGYGGARTSHSRWQGVGVKRSDRFYERLFGARSAAGSMTPLSQAHASARTQIPDAPLP